MKTHLQTSLIILFGILGGGCGAAADKSAPNWETDPLLKSVNLSAQLVMVEYELWLVDWAQSNKTATDKDLAINRITEAFFITLINALAAAPNLELIEQTAHFLDTKVPPEFDDTWKFVFIEFTNVARGSNGRLLQSEALANLMRRAVE